MLEEIDDQRVDKIVCLGDIVGIGPDTNEVMDLLIKRTDIDYVIGNHERAVITAFNNEREHHEWIAKRISEYA